MFEENKYNHNEQEKYDKLIGTINSNLIAKNDENEDS